VVVLLAAVALAYSMASLRLEGRSLQLAAPVGVAAVAIALVGATGPSAVWRHSGIGAGRFALPEGGENVLRDWMHKQRRRVLWEAEGVEASIGLVADDGLSFFINGKCDGHAINDAGTQLVSGVLAAMLHPKPKTAFIVGLGTGETPGWLAEVPSIERVDVVELEPAIDEMARLCSDVNHDVLDHRKVQMIYNDAREVLLTIPTRYDLIFSEPSNPWRAGIANLFTREFYLSCRDRLNDDGLFVQWVQGYEIDAQTVQTACATLRSVFGHVEIWQSKAEDMLMVCSRRPNTYKVELLRRRLEQEPYRSAMAKAWRATDLEGVLARYVGGPGLVDTMRSHENARINTDDHNVIEYGFARTVGLEETDFSVQDLRSTAIELGAHRPPVEGGGVDWRGVEDHRQLMYALWRGIVSLPPEATDEQKARTEVLRHYYANQPKQMLDTWSAAGYDPVEPTETSLLALAAASIGDGRAPRLIERVGTFNATEGAAIAGCFLMQRGQIDAAAASFARAFRGLREDPWPLSHAVELAAPAAAQVARHAPAHAPALYAAFSEPFAVYAYEERRLGVAHQIAIAIGPEPTLETLQAFEPHVPWNEGFLRRRAEIYRQTNHPNTARAEADLAQFLGRAKQPLARASLQ
jgi:spermidine synthase